MKDKILNDQNKLNELGNNSKGQEAATNINNSSNNSNNNTNDNNNNTSNNDTINKPSLDGNSDNKNNNSEQQSNATKDNLQKGIKKGAEGVGNSIAGPVGGKVASKVADAAMNSKAGQKALNKGADTLNKMGMGSKQPLNNNGEDKNKDVGKKKQGQNDNPNKNNQDGSGEEEKPGLRERISNKFNPLKNIMNAEKDEDLLIKSGQKFIQFLMKHKSILFFLLLLATIIIIFVIVIMLTTATTNGTEYAASFGSDNKGGDEFTFFISEEQEIFYKKVEKIREEYAAKGKDFDYSTVAAIQNMLLTSSAENRVRFAYDEITDAMIREIADAITSGDVEESLTTKYFPKYVPNLSEDEYREMAKYIQKYKEMYDYMRGIKSDDSSYCTQTSSSSFLDIAINELDASNTSKIGGEKYKKFLGIPMTDAWCAAFVSWVANQAGIPEEKVIKSSAVQDHLDYYKKNGTYHDASNYTPKSGDIILWKGTDPKTGEYKSHIGFVEKVEGDIVHTVEGNASNSVDRRQYNMKTDYITGYATIDFSDASLGTGANISTGGTCSYDIKGFYIQGKGNVEKSLPMNNLLVRLMQCGSGNGHNYGGTFGQPLQGEDLVPFEKYILGVAYQEIGPSSPAEAIKAQMVAARSYILARHVDMGGWRVIKKEGDQWILPAAACTQDQVYCDPDQGCSSSDGQWSMVYSGSRGGKQLKGPIAADSPLRTYASETSGEVLVNDKGYVVYAGYLQTEQNKMINLAKQGLSYKQILLQVYNQGNRNYGATDILKYPCDGKTVVCTNNGPSDAVLEGTQEFKDFVAKYINIGTDYDGSYGVQCVDLIKLYIDVVFGIKGVTGNANLWYSNWDSSAQLREKFDRYPYSSGFTFQAGDIIVWRSKPTSSVGHVAIAAGGDAMYDQNGGGHNEPMTYRKIFEKEYIIGVLRPKAKVNS